MQFKRRETERQAELRMSSHAWLAEREAAEPWTCLAAHGDGSPAAAGVWDMLLAPCSTNVPLAMPRADFLAALVPSAPCPAVHVDTLLVTCIVSSMQSMQVDAYMP